MVAKPLGQKYRAEHDPYNGMEEADTRPDFVARRRLSDAENNLEPIQREADDTKRHRTRHRKHSATTRLRQSEQDQPSNKLTSYRNSVTGRGAAALTVPNRRSRLGSRSQSQGRSRGRFRRLAPASIITMLLAGGGFLFYMSQTILAPHLSNLYTKATDVQYTSYNSRNQRIFRYMIDGGDQIKISTRFTKRYTTFSPYIKKRLAKNGIQVGYIDSDGVFSTKQILANHRTVLKYGDEIIDANAFQNKFASDANFREAYYRAKRGRIAGFFDHSAEAFYKKKGATRDIFNNYRSTGDAATDDKNFRETITNHVGGSDANINTVSHYTDDEGEEVKKNNGDNLETTRIEGDTPEMKARTLVNNLASKVSTKGVAACAGLRIANMAAVTVSAYQIFQSISYFLGLSEPISKTIAGEGDTAATNSTLNFLTGVTDSSVQYANKDGSVSTETYTGSPLQAIGAQLILTNTPANYSKLAPYSLKNMTGAAATIAASTGATNTVCSGVMASGAIMSLASNAIPGGKLASFVVRAVVNTVGNIAMTVIISNIIQAIIPYVAKVFVSNVFESYTGIPAGELYTQGAATANFKLATQGSGFMPASEDYVKAQNRETSIALAQEAEVDRLNRSPFDASSPNTFLGSLLSKLAFANKSSFTSGLVGFAGILRNALGIFSPSASAADEENSYTSNYQSCDKEQGTVCDIYGTEIVARDYSTIDLKPDDPKYRAVIEPNLNDKGEIIEGSELSKFINFCTERESPWGVLDANIMNALQTDFGIIGNNLFLVEDVVDIINAAEDAANEGWGTGSNCVMSADNPRWDKEMKYYQAYVEDMRILDGFDGEKSTNPVLAYVEKYEAEHPLDTSYEGTLARISGLTKDDVAYLLEFIRYSDQIANYNSAERFVFGETTSEQKHVFTKTNFDNYYAVIPTATDIFIDRRNYAV